MPEYKPIQYGLHEVLADICTTYNRFAPIIPARPYCTYKRVSTDRISDTAGNAGIASATMQISVFDDTPEGATRIANDIRLALLNTIGVTWGDHFVFGMKLENELDVEEPTISTQGKLGLFSVVLDYLITYSEESGYF